jgi:hypothetical protein
MKIKTEKQQKRTCAFKHMKEGRVYVKDTKGLDNNTFYVKAKTYEKRENKEDNFVLLIFDKKENDLTVKLKPSTNYYGNPYLYVESDEQLTVVFENKDTKKEEK